MSVQFPSHISYIFLHFSTWTLTYRVKQDDRDQIKYVWAKGLHILKRNILKKEKKRYILYILFTLIESYVAQNNCYSYLYTCDLYGPVRNAFDAGTHPLLGQVGGGWALEIVTFLGPVKWHRADMQASAIWGPKKSRSSRVESLYLCHFKSRETIPLKTLLVMYFFILPCRLIRSEKTYTWWGALRDVQ